ncbi:MAG: GMP synthase [Gammaproteobacteria bacterium]|nr:MAG: GMP synthase [Gammaproteobacteria bacterium]
MKEIWIFRHIDCEGPGHLETVLAREHVPWRLIAVDAGEAVPATLDGAAALVLLGGPMSVNDPLPWIDAELALIRAALDAGLPVLGHCLGAQLIAKALGAAVRPNPVKEIGFWPVYATAAGRAWGLPAQFTAFHWHGETFDLPAGAVRLAGSRDCANQAFSIGSALAFQFHLEVTAEQIPQWCARYPQDLADPAPTVQRPEAMQRETAALAALQAVADAVYGRWLAPLRAA